MSSFFGIMKIQDELSYEPGRDDISHITVKISNHHS